MAAEYGSSLNQPFKKVPRLGKQTITKVANDEPLEPARLSRILYSATT